MSQFLNASALQARAMAHTVLRRAFESSWLGLHAALGSPFEDAFGEAVIQAAALHPVCVMVVMDAFTLSFLPRADLPLLCVVPTHTSTPTPTPTPAHTPHATASADTTTTNHNHNNPFAVPLPAGSSALAYTLNQDRSEERFAQAMGATRQLLLNCLWIVVERTHPRYLWTIPNLALYTSFFQHIDSLDEAEGPNHALITNHLAWLVSCIAIHGLRGGAHALAAWPTARQHCPWLLPEPHALMAATGPSGASSLPTMAWLAQRIVRVGSAAWITVCQLVPALRDVPLPQDEAWWNAFDELCSTMLPT